MGKKANYIVGVIIAVGFYLISSVFSSVVNLLSYVNAGYDSFSSFMTNGNEIETFGILIFSLANHCFFAWLSAKVMNNFAKKHKCIDMWFFRGTALVFVLIIVIRLIAIGSLKGWLTILPHALVIELLGKKYCSEYNNQNNDLCISPIQYPSLEIKHGEPSVVLSVESITREQQCSNCGATINRNAKYCVHCGEKVFPKTSSKKHCLNCGMKVEEGYRFCTNCGEPVDKH